MNYKVRATFVDEKLSKFYEELTDGTVQNQKPDGAEIVASMQRAMITSPGTVEWYETCYCPTPLAHERATVYDRFLADIETAPLDQLAEIDGKSFWEHMKRIYLQDSAPEIE